jgi:hypothetical protein
VNDTWDAWDCVCGATGVAERYCPFCGRAAPGSWVAPTEPVLSVPPPHPPPAARDPYPVENPYATPSAPQPSPYVTPPGGYGGPYQGGWGGTYPAPRRRDNTVLYVVLGVIGSLVLLVVAVAVVGQVASRETTTYSEEFEFPGEFASPTPDVRAPVGTTRHSKAFDRDVRELTDWVAAEHGDRFRRPVRVASVSEAGLRQVVETDQQGLGDFAVTLTMLGLADRGDEGPTALELAYGGRPAYYVAGSDTVYLRGETLTPGTRLVLIYELALAWQDQQYDLTELRRLAPDRDALLALHGLVEGDARRVMRRWYESLPAADRRAVDADETGERVPALTTRSQRSQNRLFGMAEVKGEAFATRIAATGGNNALHAAFREPPASTELLGDPAAFLAGDPPVAVDEPAAHGRLMDHGVLGQFVLAMVADGGDTKPADLRLAAGWEGDAYVTWEHGLFHSCTTDAVLMASAAARDRLLAALRRYPVGGGGFLRASGARGLTFQFCRRR